MSKKPSASVHVIDGGEGAPREPNWSLVYRAKHCRTVAEKEREEARALENQRLAREHWQEIVSGLRDAGALAVANGHTIKRLVQFRIAYDASAADVGSLGTVIPGTKRREPRVNPHFRLMRQNDETIRQLEAELGVAPVRRGRLCKVTRKATSARPAEQWRATYKKPGV